MRAPVDHTSKVEERKSNYKTLIGHLAVKLAVSNFPSENLCHWQEQKSSQLLSFEFTNQRNSEERRMGVSILVRNSG
jgi:hypothetical protein